MRERPLPHNLQAEYAVLGSLLIDPDAIHLITDVLSAEDFYRDTHRTIYHVILALARQGVPADYITVCDALEQQQQLTEVGGPATITTMIHYVPTSRNIVFYAQIVARTALLRRLIAAGSQIVALAYQNDEADAVLILERSEELLSQLRQRVHAQQQFGAVQVSELLTPYRAWLETQQARPTIQRIPTGFVDLDHLLLGGLSPSAYILLTGEPNVGTSPFALTLAYHAARDEQRKIGIVSMASSKENIMEHLVVMESGIDRQRLRTGEIGTDDWERLTQAMEVITRLSIWMDDSSDFTLSYLWSKARQWSLTHGVDLLVIDGLQLLSVPTSEEDSHEYHLQTARTMSRALKALAHDLHISVLAVAQVPDTRVCVS